VKGGKIERHLHSLTPEEKNTSEFDLRADFFDKSTVFLIVSHTENALLDHHLVFILCFCSQVDNHHKRGGAAVIFTVFGGNISL
jgi:hypothetical protein